MFIHQLKNQLRPYSMGDVSKHFNRGEFACKCECGFAAVDVRLLSVLENIRDHFGAPVTANSACRCVEHNEKVQIIANPNYVPYSSKSKHLHGIAADIVVSGVPANDVYLFLTHTYPGKYGIGRYNSFTHIDVRSIKARW